MSNITNNGGIIYIFKLNDNNIYYFIEGGSLTQITSWPVTILNSNPVSGNILTVSITTDITISDSTVGPGTNGYFICGSSYITYDGSGKTITISNVTGYLGLIQNGINGINGYSNITVQNINSAISGNSTLAINGGYICQSYFGRGVNNIVVNNCSNSGAVNNDASGGICGFGIGSFNGNVSITNCSNSGIINSNYSGGICGVSAGFSNGIVSITNCFNNGIINGPYSGGISGAYFGITNNNLCSITNCYNTGNINGSNAGGITGANIGFNYDGSLPKVLIQNCYSLGSIASTCGGICGGTDESVYTNIPIVNIKNCYTSYNSIAPNGRPIISANLPTTVRNSIISRLTNIYTSLTSLWSDTNANSALSGALNIYRNSRLYKYYSNFGEVWYSNQNNTPFSFTSDLDNVPRRKERRN